MLSFYAGSWSDLFVVSFQGHHRESERWTRVMTKNGWTRCVSACVRGSSNIQAKLLDSVKCQMVSAGCRCVGSPQVHKLTTSIKQVIWCFLCVLSQFLASLKRVCPIHVLSHDYNGYEMAWSKLNFKYHVWNGFQTEPQFTSLIWWRLEHNISLGL